MMVMITMVVMMVHGGGTAADMAAAGAVQFGADSGKVMGYWTMPEAALDDDELARDWAARALNEL